MNMRKNISERMTMMRGSTYIVRGCKEDSI